MKQNVNRKKYNVFQAEEEIENLYRDYLKRLGKKVPIMGTRVGLNRVKTESTWGSEDILSFKDFKTAVWKKRIGEQDPLNWLLVREIPEVAKAVEVSQKYIYKMGEEYDALGIPLMYMERQIQVIKSQIKTSTGKNKKGLESWLSIK